MNEDKTELLACSIDRKAFPYVVDHMYIDSDQILFSSKAKNLGVYFDSQLSMTPHINHLAQIMVLELRRIKQIRPFLNEGAVKTLVSSFILSRLVQQYLKKKGLNNLAFSFLYYSLKSL